MHKKATRLVLLLLLAFVHTDAAAQDIYELPAAQTTRTMDAARRLLFARTAGASQPKITPAQEAAATTFASTTRAIVPRLFSSNLTRATAAERTRYEKQIESYLSDYEARRRRNGSARNHIGRAATFFILTSYFAATGDTPSQTQVDRMRLDLAARLTASPEFKRLPVKDKQIMYETFVAAGEFFARAHDAAANSGDRETQRRIRNSARLHLERLIGAPLESLRFTDEGLRF